MIVNVQAMRFLAALEVAIFHCQGFNGISPGFVTGAMGVDVFFVISGFVMVVSAWDQFGKKGAPFYFLSRRVIRIVPLYWTMTALWLVVFWWIGGIWFYPPTPGMIPKTLSGILFIPIYDLPSLAVGWTLNFEMFFYLLFASAIWLPRKFGLPLVVILIFIMTSIGSATSTSEYGFRRYWMGGELWEFVWGMAVGVLYRWGVKMDWKLAALLVIVGGATAVYFMNLPVIPTRELRIGIPSAVFLAGLVFLPQIPAETRLGRFVVLLGNSSYALYLFHWVFFFSVHAFSVPVLLVIAVLVSMALYTFVEAPILKWLRSPRQREGAVAPA